jgi:hypothetical protein
MYLQSVARQDFGFSPDDPTATKDPALERIRVRHKTHK